jgi:hypothetical protein
MKPLMARLRHYEPSHKTNFLPETDIQAGTSETLTPQDYWG